MEGFFQSVYKIVEKIPAGSVATYGQIAMMLGRPRGARMVGWAMASVPRGLKLPCHRVVNQKGALSPDHIFGGPGRQRALLEDEGVTFDQSGKINMKIHLWQPNLEKDL